MAFQVIGLSGTPDAIGLSGIYGLGYLAIGTFVPKLSGYRELPTGAQNYRAIWLSGETSNRAIGKNYLSGRARPIGLSGYREIFVIGKSINLSGKLLIGNQ